MTKKDKSSTDKMHSGYEAFFNKADQNRILLGNAGKATRVRERMLDALVKAVEDAGDDVGAVLGLLNKETSKLLVDSENRGLGTPKSSVDVTSSDGSASQPTKIVIKGMAGRSKDGD